MTSNFNIPNNLLDEHFQKHILDCELSRGGQGVVFKTKDPHLLIKLCLGEGSDQKLVTDSTQTSTLLDKFMRIGFLPMPSNLPIAMPVANLRDKAGYVMRFITDMEEFTDQFIQGRKAQKDIIKESDKAIPDWLRPFFEDEHQIKKGTGFYHSLEYIHLANSGGTRRRLLALSQCASILSRLHATGLVYVDLSPGNVFISQSHEFEHVWLIDADNMRLDGMKGDNYYTPEYGAPEVVKGQSASSQLSDCHAFSVMCFKLLTNTLPYNGIAIVEDVNDDWANDDSVSQESDKLTLDQKKERGELAYVDDPKDESNRSNSGMPRELVFTPELKKLLLKTLGEGKLAPFKRPSIYHFPKVLAQSADKQVACSNCQMTFFVEKGKCPYCDIKVPLSIKLTSFYGTDISKPFWEFNHELVNSKSCKVPNRLIDAFSYSHNNDEALLVSKETDGITLKFSNDNLSVYSAVVGVEQGGFIRLHGSLHLSHKMLQKGTFLFVENEHKSKLIRIEILGEIM